MAAYPPFDDPLLMAGVIRCRVCRKVAFPVEAGWLDETQIIAVYPRPCSHARGTTLVIDLDRVLAETPAVNSAGVRDHDLSLYVKGRRCAARNRKGRPCRSYAAPGSDYCRAHRPAGVKKGRT